MKALIKYFIRYANTADVAIFLIAVVGIFSLMNMTRSAFPRVESRIILVQCVYPGASPQEVENGVTTKIEEELKGVSGIKKITSTSRENTATITVELPIETDVDVAISDVKNAVDRINSFPDGLETPVIYKLENVDLAAEFAISGDVDLKTLKAYAKLAEEELLLKKNVSKVILNGYPDEEIEIAVRENELNTYGLTFDQIAAAVRRSNIDLTGGTFDMGDTEITIRARNKKYTAEGLENVIVATSATGTNIRLKDVADVTDKWADNPTRTYYDGKPAVTVTVNSTLDEDIIEGSETVKTYIEEFNQRFASVQADVIRDGSVNIRNRTDLLVKNGAIGMVLVLLVLGLFLNPRIAFWVALSIPISILGMFIIAPFFNISINLFSLFGLILSIGILVDDGVVIAENIFQKYEAGMPAQQAAYEGTIEVVPSIISAVLTTCLFFTIFFFLGGRIGDFISNIAFVVIVVLLFSLIEGFFILPAHIAHSKALRPDIQPTKVEKTTTRFFDYLKNKIYAPSLQFSLDNKFLTFVIFFVMLFFSINLLRGGIQPFTFFPNIDFDELSVSLRLPAGTTEDITKDYLTKIERAAFEVNEEIKNDRADGEDVITAVVRNIGPGTNEGSLNVILLDGEIRDMESFEISNAIRAKVGPIYEAEKLTFGRAAIFGSPVAVSFLGKNYNELRAAKNEFKAALNNMPTLKDIVDDDVLGSQELNMTLRKQAEALGLNLQTIVNQVRQGYFGVEVQRLQRGNDEVKIWVRYAESARQSQSGLENMKIRVNGRAYPLKELVNLESEDGVLNINHVDGRTKIEVTAEQANPDASTTEILTDVQTNVMPKILAKYPGVEASFGGQSETAGDTGAAMQRTMPIILLLVLAVVTLTFRSFKQAIMVILLIPFAFVGVVVGHMIHGIPVSFLSIFGILALAGIVINDSLVLINAMNTNLRNGIPLKQAVYDASLTRFRPIVLTTITTVAGLLPIVAEGSLQAKFLKPMAISLSYGLIAAMFIMLLLLPVFILGFNLISQNIYWLWEGEKLESEEFEPAFQEVKGEA